MERLLQTLKDPSKLSLLLSALFYVGLVSSAYVLVTLPHDLVFKGGMISTGLATLVYTKLFITLIITFGLGIFAINTTNKAKKEIVVFKEKKNEATTTTNGDTAGQSSFDTQAFTRAIKGATPDQLFQVGINHICKTLDAGQGAFYLLGDIDGKRVVEMKSAFAIPFENNEPIVYELGEGLVGQCAVTGKSMLLDELPEGYTNAIVSGLGMAAPKYILIIPVKKGEVITAVLEIATFSKPTSNNQKEAEQMAKLLAEQI
ncbi:MAG: GAF domain-containing protein [Cyclobacteriaceae bacterium]|nr:GAF domain-containing protein [Cyclobacteriaceae bacterium]